MPFKLFAISGLRMHYPNYGETYTRGQPPTGVGGEGNLYLEIRSTDFPR